VHITFIKIQVTLTRLCQDQAVRHHPVTAETQVQSDTSSCGVGGG